MEYASVRQALGTPAASHCERAPHRTTRGPSPAEGFRTSRSVSQAQFLLSRWFKFGIELAEDDTPAPPPLRGALLVHVVGARGVAVSGAYGAARLVACRNRVSAAGVLPTTCYAAVTFEGDVRTGSPVRAASELSFEMQACFEVRRP